MKYRKLAASSFRRSTSGIRGRSSSPGDNPGTTTVKTSSALMKRPQEPARKGPEHAQDDEEVQVSTKTARLLEDLRPPFMAYCSEFVALTKTRSQLAPKFMKVYHIWSAETNGTFVDFVRELDPSVPEDREAYRSHSSYQAADYLRRLVAETAREEVPEADRPVSPLSVIATLLATLEPLVVDMKAVWGIFQKTLRWPERRIKNLQRLMAESPPLLVKSGQERKLHPAD